MSHERSIKEAFASFAPHNTWVLLRPVVKEQGQPLMSATSAPSYRTSRILVWILFCSGVFACFAIGVVLGGQGVDNFSDELMRTRGRGEILMAAGFLVVGPMLLWVLKDAFLAIFGFKDQAMALRREMNALASRPAAKVTAAVVRPPAPWQCPDCGAENAMADVSCSGCGIPFSA
jgi:hypothetical protein